MDKTFAFTLDDKIPVNPSNKFEIWRGDNIVFNFTFKSGSDDLPTPAGTTLRVFAKKIGANGLVDKADNPLFAGDFTTPTTASFDSTQTAGEAGNYLLSVLLMSSDSEVITAQGIYFELKENGYAGIYQPSEDYRDEVIDALNNALAAAASASSSATQSADSATASANSANAAALSANAAKQSADSAATSDSETATMLALAQEAQSNAAASATASAQSATDAQAAQAAAELAKNQAQEIVDPDNRIGQLFQTKLDTGVLYCNGGSASATPNLAFDTLSVLFKTDFDFSVAQTTTVLYPFYIGRTAQGKYILVQFGADDRLRINTGDGVFGSFSRPDIAALTGDGLNALAFVFKKLADGNAQVSLFVNGVSVQNLATGMVEYPALESFLSINKWGSSRTSAGRVGYSDFRILNFDVSATDALYTLSDYQNGAAIPPWSVPIVFGNGKSATASAINATCVWNGANWSMTQANNTATIKSMLYYIPLNIGQKLRIKFSNLTGGVLVDGKYGFFQPVRQEADQINVSTTSLDAEFTAQTPITLWRFQFNCEAVSDVADRVATVFENFTVERDGAVVALENYTIARNTTTKLIKDASGNGNDATVSGVLAGDRDNAVAAFVDELKMQINQQA